MSFAIICVSIPSTVSFPLSSQSRATNNAIRTLLKLVHGTSLRFLLFSIFLFFFLQPCIDLQITIIKTLI